MSISSVFKAEKGSQFPSHRSPPSSGTPQPHPSLPPRPAQSRPPSTLSSRRDIAEPMVSRSPIYRPPHLRLSSRPPRRRPHRANGMYAGLSGQVDRRTLDELPVDLPTTITDVGLAGGYKWITNWSAHDDGCNIAVPAGLPDVWRGDERAVKQVCHDVELEGNIEFADYNGASTPAGTSPHETVFLSLVGPEVLRGVQLITARNNLKKLLVSCSRTLQLSKSTPDPRKDDDYMWRIDAWVVPGTDLALLDRWEPPVRRRPREANSFHLAYHEATTAKLQIGSDRTPGCQRLISYTFSGIKMIVKCDIDAAFPWDDLDQSDSEDDAMSDVSMSTVIPGAEENDGSTVTGHTDETYLSMITSLENIARLSDSTLGERSYSQTSAGIRVHWEPLPHPPHESLLSVKTRQWRKGQSLEDVNHLDSIFANIFWAQVPTLMLGWHDRGDFSVAPPTRLHLGEGPLKDLEERHQPAISKVRALLEWMLGHTRQQGRMAFICDGHTIVAYKLGTTPTELSREAWAVISEAGLIRDTDIEESPLATV